MNLKKLTNNWIYKLLCLALAVILYVFHQVSEVEKKTFVIPLTIVENGSVTHVDGKKKSVSVTVRANADQITQIHSTDITASVNLDALPKSGEYSVPVNIDINQELLMNNPFEIQVSPEVVKVRVEKKDVQFIKVIPSIVGECKHGYEVTNINVEPEFIEVIGPESLLKNTAEIKTEMIDISNASKSFSVNTNAIDISNAITITNTGPYKVTFEVTSIDFEKLYENVTILLKGLPEQFVIKGEKPKINFKVAGPMSTLENYELPIDCVSIDLSSITESGSYDFPVKINLPSSYKVIEQSLDTISLSVDVVDNSALYLDENANLILE